MEQRFRQLEDTIHLTGAHSLLNAQLIRRFGEVALMRGHEVHFYHDALWPSKIDHLIIPHLQLGVTTQVPPHELPFGKRPMVHHIAETPLLPQESPEGIETWWTTYQKFYTHAWQLMEQLADLSHPPESLPSLMIHRFPA